MLPQKRGPGKRGKEGIVRYGNERRVIDAAEVEATVQPFGEPEDREVRFGRRSDDELRALAGRSETGRVLGADRQSSFRCVFGDPAADVLHGAQDRVAALLRGERVQAAFGRQLDIHADPVRQQPDAFDQFRRRTGNGLRVDVAVESVEAPQQRQRSRDAFHRFVRGAEDARTQEQTFDIIPPVEFHREIRDLFRGKDRPRDVVASPVDAVGAVVGAHVCHEDLEQGDASPVLGPRVTDSARRGVPRPRRVLSLAAGGGTGCVVLRGVGEYGEFVTRVHGSSLPKKC